MTNDPERIKRVPWLLRVALRLFVDSDARGAILSDLMELHHHHVQQFGEKSAARWLRRQARQFAVRLPFDRFMPSSTASPFSHSIVPRERLINVTRDIRHAVRTLIYAPVFTLTVVLTVGFGIGGTTAVFSVVNAVLVEPLPYSNPERLFRIYTNLNGNPVSFSVVDYQALLAQQTSFAGIAAYASRPMTFFVDGVAERVHTQSVTPGYFELLGITPVIGRTLREPEGLPGSERVAMVSYGFWLRRLGGDTAAIGRSIRLNGVPHTVVGVLPEHAGPLESGRDIFPALQLQTPTRKGPFFLTPIASLDPKSDPVQASSELREINRRIFPIWEASYTDQETTWGMMALKQHAIGDVAPLLAVTLAAVVFVLLMASTNTANLLLARTTEREPELAVRAALGASRPELVRHLLAESVVLTCIGALVGGMIAVVGVRLITALGGDFLPRLSEVAFETPVVLFFGITTLGSAVLFGVAPAILPTGKALEGQLRSGNLRSTASANSGNLRRVLVASQFAIGVPLLIGAGLLLASLRNLQRVSPGFDTSDVLTVRVTLPSADYAPGDLSSFWNEATSRIAALPGIRRVGVSVGRPPREFPFSNNQNLLDKPTPDGQTQVSVPWNYANPDFFEALGVSLRAGRMFRQADSNVVLVDEAWARRFYPDVSAIGKRFRSGGCTVEGCPSVEIVGIVDEISYTGIENDGQGVVYMNFDRNPSWTAHLILRTEVDPISVLPSVRSAIRGVNPAVPLSDEATMDELIRDSLQAPRYLAMLVAGFGGMALVLAVIGIYGVMSYFVHKQRRDISIRVALGGRPRAVLGMIVARGMRLVAVGSVVGLAVALVMTRYMSSLLYGIAASDPVAIGATMVTVWITALAACALPARRAAQIPPARALRGQ